MGICRVHSVVITMVRPSSFWGGFFFAGEVGWLLLAYTYDFFPRLYARV